MNADKNTRRTLKVKLRNRHFDVCSYNSCMSKPLLRVWLALALAFGLAASSFDDHMAKGRAAIADQDFSTAEREYQAALREVNEQPGDGRVLLAYEGLA